METQLVDWRYGREPRQDVLDYFKSKGYLRTSEGLGKDDEVFTTYHIEAESLGMARMIQELSERYDIMITESFIAIDTKGYRFKERGWNI